MTPTTTESGLSYTITVTLSDSVGIAKTDYEMDITVKSLAPVFTSNPVS
jgi:hypothetical protein